MSSPALRLLFIAALSLVGFGCSSVSPAREESLDSAGSAEGADQAAEPAPKLAETPREGDLSPDPYRKVPSGKGERERPKQRPPAAFKAPNAEVEPTRRALERPTRLAVSFVRNGRFTRGGRELLRLEASLAEAPGLREVIGHPLPRGAPRDLVALGREVREAEGDLLLVVSLSEDPTEPPGQAWLIHCQHATKEPALLAHFDPPPAEGSDPPENAAFTSDEPDSLANLVARIALAHRELRKSD
jgi:hypothetical protein